MRVMQELIEQCGDAGVTEQLPTIADRPVEGE
jgi:hypothetical protein